MLIILRSNYLTIIAISLMIILFFFPLLPLFSVFQWCRLYGLDHLFAIRVFPKNIPKGVLLSLSIIPLAYQDILRTFKQKDVKEEDTALLLSPSMLRTEADRLWKPPSDPVLTSPSTWSGDTERSSVDTDGTAETASLLLPSWSETALVIAIEQEWI